MRSRRSSTSLFLLFAGSILAALAPALGCSRGASVDDDPGDSEGALGAAAACHEVGPVTTSGLSPALQTALGGAKRADCTVQTDRGPKAMHVLTLRGAFPQITRAHGFLLGQQVADGSFSETLRLMEKEIGEGGAKAKLVYDCYMRRIQNGLSPEFKDGVDAMIEGAQEYFTAQGKPIPDSLKNKEELARAAIAIEWAIAAEGLKVRLANGDKLAAAKDLVFSCGGELADWIFGDGEVPKKTTDNLYGCSGLSMPGSMTADGRLVHARNLDGDLVVSWNSAPTVSLVDETAPAGKRYHRYVGAATAGLPYPAGISGFNDAGLAVSLHEMQTTNYRTNFNADRVVFTDQPDEGAIGPYIQQRILRETATIDEAYALVKSIGRIGGWTIFVSDAKANQAASIEMTGEKVTLFRRPADEPAAQANHFYSAEMQDQYYNYDFNKVLESLSRDAFLSSELKSKAEQAKSGGQKADTLSAINLLASHTDAFEGFSSFGRTVVKAYTMMSTVMKPPTASVKTGELWVTLGERTPIPHSTFVGFKVDFDAMTMTPIGTQKTTNWKHLPHYDRSLELYTTARSQYVLGSPEEKSRSIALIDAAIQEAQQDESIQQSDRPTQLLPYWFVRARVQHEVGRFEEAMASWDELLQADRFALLQDFGKALVEAYSVATSDKLPAGHPKKLDTATRDARLGSALGRMQAFLGQVRPGNRFDLQNKIDLGKKLQKGEDVTLPEIDFVVVYN